MRKNAQGEVLVEIDLSRAENRVRIPRISAALALIPNDADVTEDKPYRFEVQAAWGNGDGLEVTLRRIVRRSSTAEGTAPRWAAYVPKVHDLVVTVKAEGLREDLARPEDCRWGVRGEVLEVSGAGLSPTVVACVKHLRDGTVAWYGASELVPYSEGRS